MNGTYYSTLLEIINGLEPIYAINAAIELSGAVMVVIATVAAFGLHLKKKFFQYALLVYIFTFISAVGDAIAGLLRGMPGEDIRLALQICNFLSMLGASFDGFLFANVLFYTYKRGYPKVYRGFHIATFVLLSVMVLVLVISQFTGWIFTIDENNIYRRGPFFFITAIYTILLVLCAIIYMMPRTKRFTRHDLHSLFFYFTIPIVGAIMQWLFPGFAFLEMVFFLLIVVIILRTQKYYMRIYLRQAEELTEKETAISRLREQLLLSQVRPHFIYNTLTAMQRIKGNPPETIIAIDNFAKYLRQNLIVTDDITTIPFKQELEHIQTYVNIEKIRFGGTLEVAFDIQDTDFEVPILAIQLLVENSIKHGIRQKETGGVVTVSSYKEGNDHIVTVVDNGIGFDVNAPLPSGHIGLNSCRNRLFYYTKGTLVIESTIGVGTKAIVTIPGK